MDTKVTIVIITRNTKELLDNLLGSIQEDSDLCSISRTVIVDNASTDQSEEMVKEKYPAVYFLKNDKNMGFAYSANKGFSMAEGEYTLFLNSDTIVIPGEFQKIIAFMDEHMDVAICGPQLVYADMKPQRSYAAIPSLSTEFGSRFNVQGSRTTSTIEVRKSEIIESAYVSSNSATRTSGLIDPTTQPSNDPRAYDVPSLIGAAILVRSDLMRKVNGFDERFFFFLEETDLCVRMRAAGGRIVFLQEARVIHLQGKTVRKSWIEGRIEYNISLNKFIRKHHSRTYYGAFKAVRLLKAFFSALVFPLLLVDRTMRIKYRYYLRLFSWYLAGCPENAGIRRQN